MQGIELSRRFYSEVVRPWLGRVAPGLPHSAALVGYGSELLGFDDETSRDHNWGPRVQLFVSEADFERWGRRLVEAFAEAAPADFLGEPIGWRSRPMAPAGGEGAAGSAGHGLEVFTIAAMLERLLGLRSVEGLSTLQWLGLPEQRLLAMTAGAVFHDDGGRLGQVRAALAYFPEDAWLYQIACQWRRIAEEQAFVGRTGQAGDDLGSRVMAARLARDVMRMAFLLCRQYAPYSKWLGSGFSRLPLAARLSPLLRRALMAEGWQERGEALADAYLVLARVQVTAGIGGAVEPAVGPYHDRPFATINADEMVAASLAGIADPVIRALPVTGSIDQVSDLTPVLEDPAGSMRVIRALLG
jgi:hypothetical protein